MLHAGTLLRIPVRREMVHSANGIKCIFSSSKQEQCDNHCPKRSASSAVALLPAQLPQILTKVSSCRRHLWLLQEEVVQSGSVERRKWRSEAQPVQKVSALLSVTERMLKPSKVCCFPFVTLPGSFQHHTPMAIGVCWGST